jgi:CheY-like chemotaxis protein
VSRSALHVCLSAVCLLALVAPVPAQDEEKPKEAQAPKKEPKKKTPEEVTDDYRNLFKKPETTLEFWKAMQFELDVGRFDLAARQLHGLLDKKPEDRDLLDIVDREGMSAFLRLRNIQKWGPDPQEDAQAKRDVEELIRQVGIAEKRVLTDPDRIGRFVRNLNGDPEERAYAVTQLYRSGAAAVPQLVDALREADADQRENVLYALKRMGTDAVPGILAALDVPDAATQVELIDAVQDRKRERQVFDPLKKKTVTVTTTDLQTLRRRGETDPAPWWFALTHSPNDLVRKKAVAALAELYQVEPYRLPQAKHALTETAERYYRHKVRFLDPGHVVVWRWDGKRLVAGWPGATTVPTSTAEQYYGLKFARDALAIDPTYEPAQVVFLSLALEKGVEKAGLDQSLGKGAPEVMDLAARVNPSLVVAVLDRALAEGNLPVILGGLRTLGDMADPRALLPTSGHGESPLIRALYYPERRIQMAAAEALLRTPPLPDSRRAGRPVAPPAAARVVEVLRRLAAAGPAATDRPKVVIAHAREDVTTPASHALEQAGFQPVVAHTGRDMLRRLHEAADIDLLIVDADLPDPGLASLLGQVRSDVNSGLIPVIVLAPTDREDRLRLLTDHYRNVQVAPPGLALDAAAERRILPVLIAEALGPPLTGEQLTGYADRALAWLARMARGEVAGYDVRPAGDTVLEALRSGRLSKDAQLSAIEVATRLPGSRPQHELAEVVIDPNRDAEVRAAAARQLVRNVEQRGPALDGNEVRALQAVLGSSTTAPAVRDQVALVMGSLRPGARLTGERLQQFQPPPPSAPASKEEKKEPAKPGPDKK